MRDTRYIILVLLSSLLMLTGCSRRDVLDDYPVSGVEISLDWAGVTDELPEGVRIIFYPKDGEGRKVDRYLSVQGGEMKVPPGRYSVVAYNYNTEVVRIRGEESYETIEAYTGYCNGLGIAGTEKMVWSPDPLYVLNIDELKIKKSDEVFHLDWKLESVIKNYSFAIEVKGLEYVTSVIGCVNGLSDCYCIGKGCGMCNSQPIYFEAKKEGGKVIAHFTAFKGAKDIPTRMSMLGEPVLSPVINHLLFAMPAAAVLPAILIKSGLLAGTAALAARYAKNISLLALLGVVLSYQIIGTVFEWALCGNFFLAVQDFRMGIPGMLIQWFGGYALLKAIAKK